MFFEIKLILIISIKNLLDGGKKKKSLIHFYLRYKITSAKRPENGAHCPFGGLFLLPFPPSFSKGLFHGFIWGQQYRRVKWCRLRSTNEIFTWNLLCKQFKTISIRFASTRGYLKFAFCFFLIVFVRERKRKGYAKMQINDGAQYMHKYEHNIFSYNRMYASRE